MPVLALALVIEARTIMSKWEPGRLRAYKKLQGVLWAVPLLAFALAEGICFRALAGDPVRDFWTVIIRVAIVFSMGSIIISPALEFVVRSYARPIARMAGRLAWLTTPVRRYLWRHDLSVSKRRWNRALIELEADLGAIEARLANIEASVAECDDPDSVDSARELREVEVVRQSDAYTSIKQRIGAARAAYDRSEVDRFTDWTDERLQKFVSTLEPQLERMSAGLIDTSAAEEPKRAS
ncbi:MULTISPECIES: hypothetical protein [Kribbella]|nr:MULTISPECIES: hypothetical protein [Kribbella]